MVSSMKSWSRAEIVDEWPGGFGWRLDERLQRTSHALLVDGRVWLIDPVDADGVEERVRALGEPAGVLQLLDRHERDCAAWAERLGVAAPARVGGRRGNAVRARCPCATTGSWREVALWEPSARTLVCADALGTLAVLPRAGRADRLASADPPVPAAVVRARAAGADPRRPRRGPARARGRPSLQEALRTARRRIPAALLALVRTSSWAASR